ncbi:MAG: NAD(P)/FAD-dependent oxidoreductase [Lachnospiraceae bacterium]|nr:NAD(P)/FAD-dependent oxidoreductase [Lachnospiraceae bacterium]
MKNNIVIIGGGIAAVNAIKAIRELDQASEIHLIQNEHYYPYYRIRLTKSLFEPLKIDKLLIQKQDWYEQNKVHLYLGREAVAVDTAKNKVSLDNGTELEYVKLLLANGAGNATPKIDGIEKSNVYSIRKFSDIEAIRANVDDKRVILCIGGGIQNLEAAWAMCSQGKNVTIAEFQDRLMPRQLDAKASEILQNAVKRNNVQILLNTAITKITGSKEANGAVTKNGRLIECDMVIYSVGIRSNTALYENTPLEINRGVIVNHHMKTSLDHVYAAGDIAELDGRVGGLWSIAMEQGKIAGYSIAGKEASYSAAIPVTNMNAFNLSIFSIGEIDENNAAHTLVEESPDDSTYRRIFIKDNRIVGAIIIGNPRNNMLIKKYVENKLSLPDIDFTKAMVEDLIQALNK